MNARQMIYDLRRLRHHGLIERPLLPPIPGHRHGALHRHGFIGAVHDRLLPAGLAELQTPVPTKLRAASHAYQTAIDNLAHGMGLAA